MSEQAAGEVSLLDYQLCSYRGSRLQFRGPFCDLNQPYIATLGGMETFGRYVEYPYPSLLGDWLELPVLNLGTCQAGLTLFSEEQWLLDAATKAEFTVLQVLGAQNMSNRMYSVHRRRNDRFLAASPALCEMYPDVDFSQINFTGHLLKTLKTRSRPGYDVVVGELKLAWVNRMRRIVQAIKGDVFLLWMSDRSPKASGQGSAAMEPALIDCNMLDELAPDIVDLIQIVEPPTTRSSRLQGKQYSEADIDAALACPGIGSHKLAAEQLAIAVKRHRNKQFSKTANAGA